MALYRITSDGRIAILQGDMSYRQLVTDAEWAAYQAWANAGSFPDPCPPDLRVDAIRADAGRIDLITRLKTATPEQIDTWVDNNVTTIAAARTLFKAILKAIALDQRT